MPLLQLLPTPSRPRTDSGAHILGAAARSPSSGKGTRRKARLGFKALRISRRRRRRRSTFSFFFFLSNPPFSNPSQAPESALPRPAGHPRLRKRAGPRHGAPVLPAMREGAEGGKAPCRLLCRAVFAAASGQAVPAGKWNSEVFFSLVSFFLRFDAYPSSVETVLSSARGIHKEEESNDARGESSFGLFSLSIKKRKKAVARHVGVKKRNQKEKAPFAPRSRVVPVLVFTIR